MGADAWKEPGELKLERHASCAVDRSVNMHKLPEFADVAKDG